MDKLIFEKSALEDLYFWVQNDLKTVKKNLHLNESIQKTPYSGIVKPEPFIT